MKTARPAAARRSRARSDGARPVRQGPIRTTHAGCTGGGCDRCAGEAMEAKARAAADRALGPGAPPVSSPPPADEAAPWAVRDLPPGLAGRLADELPRRHPLDPATAGRFGIAFGRPMDRIRVHDGAEADRLARGAGNVAFAHGPHLLFAAGRYDPGSRRGIKLIAHEIAHTMQPGAATTLRRATGSDDLGMMAMDYDRMRDAAVKAIYPAGSQSRKLERLDLSVDEAQDLKNAFDHLLEHLAPDVSEALLEYYSADNTIGRNFFLQTPMTSYAETRGGFGDWRTNYDPNNVYRAFEDGVPGAGRVDATDPAARAAFIAAILFHEYVHVLQGGAPNAQKEGSAWAAHAWYAAYSHAPKEIGAEARQKFRKGGEYEEAASFFQGTLDMLAYDIGAPADVVLEQMTRIFEEGKNYRPDRE